MHQCPDNLFTLSLSDVHVCRDEPNNCQIKNLQNPFLVECSPLMVRRYNVSSCSSWCHFFASGLKNPERVEEFLEQCNSKFLKFYRRFELEPVGGAEYLPSIGKLINVQPCGLPRKRSFVIDICNCTDGGKNFTMLGTESEKDSEIQIRILPSEESNLDLPITSSDALPLSYSCSGPVGSGPVV